MERQQPSLGELFYPRGVAVVGVSPASSFGFSNTVLQALKEADFPCIYPVNPKYQEAFGLKCYPSLRDIPGLVDHVIVCIPAEGVLHLLDDCAAKGVKSVHFFTAGFSETGYREREELERQVLNKARAAGIRIIGPNCVGLFCAQSRLSNNLGAPLEPGHISFFSQSGGHAQQLPLDHGCRGLRFSKMVSYGNALDVDESEVLEYLAEDPDTEIIAGYIEGVKEGRRFCSALRKASACKPVVIYKGGVREGGSRTARSHTASLSLSPQVFDALCRQARAIRVSDMEELADVLVALSFMARPLQGPGVGIVGAGGGPSVLISDELEEAGLKVPSLPSEVRDELKGFLPLAGGIFSNPVDSNGLLDPANLLQTLKVLGALPYIHLFLYHLGFHPVTRWGRGRITAPTVLGKTIEALNEARQSTGRPVLVALCPATNIEGMKEFLRVQEACAQAGFPVFYSPRQLAKAITYILAWESRSRC